MCRPYKTSHGVGSLVSRAIPQHPLTTTVRCALNVIVYTLRAQGRLPQLRTVRSKAQHSLGVLDAPAGSVCVVFMHVVGTVSLMDWRPELAHEALAMFRDHVTTELIKHQGYLVRGCVRVQGSAGLSVVEDVIVGAGTESLLSWSRSHHPGCPEGIAAWQGDPGVRRERPGAGRHSTLSYTW